MRTDEIEQKLLRCFEHTEWHISLWFPRVTREVVGFPADVTDAEVQACLVRMIDSGLLETGTVEGSEFMPSAPQAGNAARGDLYIRATHVAV